MKDRHEGVTVQARQEAFLEDLEDQSRSIGQTAAQEILRRMPSYHVLGPAPGELIAGVIEQSYRLLVRLIREQRDMEPEEAKSAHALSTARAEIGIPLADSLAAQRVSGQVVWDAFRKVAASHTTVDRDFLLDITARAFRYLNALGAGITEAHLEVAHDREEQQTELERTLIDALLRKPQDLRAARRTALAARVDLDQPWQVAVLQQVADPKETAAAATPRRLRARLSLPDRTVLAAPEGEVTRVLIGGVPIEPEALDLDGFAGGVSRVHEGLEELAASALEASQTLEVAHRRGGGALSVDDVCCERFLAGQLSPDDLVNRLLAPLEDMSPDRQTMMIESLEAYLDEECSVTAAARRLYLHPQSFRYRLGKLQEHFGEQLDAPRRRMLLHVAVTRYRESIEPSNTNAARDL